MDELGQLFEVELRRVVQVQAVVRMQLQRRRYVVYKEKVYSSVICIQKGVYCMYTYTRVLHVCIHTCIACMHTHMYCMYAYARVLYVLHVFICTCIIWSAVAQR